MMVRTLKSIGKILFWIALQIGVITFLECIGIRPHRFIGKGLYFGGPGGGLIAMGFYFVCFCLCSTYTIVGLWLNKKLQMNSHRWWKTVAILYLVYVVLCVGGLYYFIDDWFFEGYGAYAADVCAAPLLWLGELELLRYLKLAL